MDAAQRLVQLLEVAAGDRDCPTPGEPLSAAVIGLLTEGLEGNRALKASPWAVVMAAVRAYPLQLAASVDKAQLVCPGGAEDELLHAWALQAIADGSLAALLLKVAAQPQICSAYRRTAPLRDGAALQRVCEQLQEAQGAFPGPYDLLQAHQAAAPAQQQQALHPAAAAAPRTGHRRVPSASRIQTEEDVLPSATSAAAAAAATTTSSRRLQGAPGKVSGAVKAALGAAGAAAAARLQPLSSGGGRLLARGPAASPATARGDEPGPGQLAAAAAPAPQGSTAAAGGGGWRFGRAARTKQQQAAAPDAAAPPSSQGQPGEQQHRALQVQLRVREGDPQRPLQLVVLQAAPRPPQAADDDASSSGASSSSSGGAIAAGRPAAAGARHLQGIVKAASAGIAGPLSGLRAAAASAAPWQRHARASAPSGDAAAAGGGGAGRGGDAGARVTVQLRVAGDASGDGEAGRLVQVLLRCGPGPATRTPSPAAPASSPSPSPSPDALEGDLWSLRAVLRKAASTSSSASRATPAPNAGGAPGGSGGGKQPPPAAPRGDARKAAAEAAAAALQATAPQVLQQVVAAADAVQACAWQGRVTLDGDCAAVVQLVGAVLQLLEHGLGGPGRDAAATRLQPLSATNGAAAAAAAGGGPSEAAAAADAGGSSGGGGGGGGWQGLQGWLAGRAPHALQAMQCLEAGDKQHAPAQLGAGAVLGSPVVRTLPPHQQTQWWVHSSLNQQLLGWRLAVVASRSSQLACHYRPGACLLLPEGALAPLVRAVRGCDVLRFDLAVPQPDAVAPGPAPLVGSRAAAAALAAASQGLNKLAAKLPPMPRLPFIAAAPGAGSGGGGGGGRGGAAAAAHASPGSSPAGGGGSGGGPAPFAWPEELGAAAGGGGAASGRGGRRRQAHIQDLPLDVGDSGESGGLLSPASSGLLSPLAHCDGAAADWWVPGGDAWQRAGSAEPTQPAAAAAAAAAAGSAREAGPCGSGGSGGLGTTSNAALQLEQQLSQALAAPLPELLVRTARWSEDAGAAGWPVGEAPPSSSSGNSHGWDAAVAAARARCQQQRPCSSQGPLLSPVAGAQVDVGAGGSRRGRHAPKRSSSANDLPDLAALTRWDPRA